MQRAIHESPGRKGLLVSEMVRDQRGVTGLETAIILIAFVVVASVFAFTVLSTDIFSSERGKETVFAGLAEAQGTLEPKGRTTANGLKKDVMSLADVAWTAGNASTTVTVDTGDKKEGTGSADLLLATGMTTGLSAYKNLDAVADLTSQTQISFWIKSSTTTIAGQIEVVLDENLGCGSPEANIDVPALTLNTWTKVTAGITQNATTTAVTDANKNAIRCVGVNITATITDSQAETINIDQVGIVGIVDTILITATNAVEGEPVDLTAPSDANDDGIADSDSENLMVISYNDKNQLVRNIHWTKSFKGKDDGDDLLEAGETVEFTIYLKGLADATPLTRGLTFTLNIKPAIGATIVLQRTTPPVIDLVMTLE
jgi:flagellin-like protein